ncbi:pyruvate kinase [Desertifilum sp. FACHB-1129]|uniref:Pyruvate kinase n=1 Tax=Desertifilum tharense IPPAS B-1220 TaxID=1781255 RepID=A0A1E5QL29_9CYAN|nr:MULTISPECIES: pyruvate kinase [Desertifilum]MDA0212845.1 pyruvate kinase [Cyanobacteria bacterium FC1]MBD2314449.1 pyruvate kinase [Desertifilum sp. FACHB-1129]MBD2321698.1 pyruvate kinase [Desertifilum sp. FACHB-866]MBD2331825.1 pyruvate kinase [Desertifilum sp. FACHB-868]OEJ75386.1 pyruvate kinase [Desertifilum tharense IPPAS B-1220]
MISSNHRTKIVATLGPASRSPEVLKRMVEAGMSVARLNFSHGSYEDHAQTVSLIRTVSRELDTPITILQDLQGPKIRVGYLPKDEIELIEGEFLTLVPIDEYDESPDTVSIDYPYLAEEAQPGTQIMLDDGLLELVVCAVQGNAVQCQILKGGTLKSRKGVNLPNLNLRLPSLTDKDKQDLEFGISQGVDWVSLSFIRSAEDIRSLKALLAQHNADLPVIAKLEKPQAIENLESILDECDGVMVARGDLGVEVRPEKVPMIQKHIIRRCNHRGLPVITATQMLESMIHNPRPTRAEASDVANAIVDGTDAVMLSGESAVGAYPVHAVEIMARIASEVEKDVVFDNLPPADTDETHAISEALNVIDKIVNLRCVVAFTSSGYSAMLASGERPKVPVVALTPNIKVYHRLNLIWGVKPLWIDYEVTSFEDVIKQAEACLLERNLAIKGDRILIMGGIPMSIAGGTNFLKIHKIPD